MAVLTVLPIFPCPLQTSDVHWVVFHIVAHVGMSLFTSLGSLPSVT